MRHGTLAAALPLSTYSSCILNFIMRQRWTQLPSCKLGRPILPQARLSASTTNCSRKTSVTVRASASIPDEQKFTITTPLYYANAEPHMGGAYSTIAADVMARFQRLQGKCVTFITGTDEHGEKIAASAEKAGMSPKAHCDRIADSYRDLWSQLDISYDRFVRTTDAKHEKTVEALLEHVWEKGDIYKAEYSGKYCVGCEEYKDDEDLDEDGNCLIHRAPCPERKEENYFFSLTKHAEAIRAFVAADGRVLPTRARNEVAAWIADDVRDFSISRSAVEWGIQVPRDPAQTVYVWFDALIGYLSALLPEGVEPTPDNLKAHGWPADVHIIGKDILRFHAVYWPGMLQSMDLPMPDKVFGHGFLTKDGLKMGKSLGNVLNPFELVGGYGSDAVRFYFMKEISFGQDGDFSEQRFRDIVNAALANDIGNLLNRSLNLLKKNCDSRFPVSAASIPEEHPMRLAVAAAVPKVEDAYKRMAFNDAILAAQTISGRGNQLLEETAPWTALKKGTPEEAAVAAETLLTMLESVRIIAVLLEPVVPGLSRKIYTQLGLGDEFETLVWQEAVKWGVLEEGKEFPKPVPAFQRIEGDFIIDKVEAAAAA